MNIKRVNISGICLASLWHHAETSDQLVCISNRSLNSSKLSFQEGFLLGTLQKTSKKAIHDHGEESTEEFEYGNNIKILNL